MFMEVIMSLSAGDITGIIKMYYIIAALSVLLVITIGYKYRRVITFVYKVATQIIKQMIKSKLSQWFTPYYVVDNVDPEDRFLVVFKLPFEQTIYKLRLKRKSPIKILSGCKDVTEKIKPYIYNSDFRLDSFVSDHKQITVFKGGICKKYLASDQITIE